MERVESMGLRTDLRLSGEELLAQARAVMTFATCGHCRSLVTTAWRLEEFEDGERFAMSDVQCRCGYRVFTSCFNFRTEGNDLPGPRSKVRAAARA